MPTYMSIGRMIELGWTPPEGFKLSELDQELFDEMHPTTPRPTAINAYLEWRKKQEKKVIKRYSWPAQHEVPDGRLYDGIPYHVDIAEALREWRREYVNLRAEMLAYIKEFRDHAEARKFFKEMAAEYMRFERACNLMLPYFECKGTPIPPKQWPIELEFELNMVSIDIICLPTKIQETQDNIASTQPQNSGDDLHNHHPSRMISALSETLLEGTEIAKDV